MLGMAKAAARGETLTCGGARACLPVLRRRRRGFEARCANRKSRFWIGVSVWYLSSMMVVSGCPWCDGEALLRVVHSQEEPSAHVGLSTQEQTRFSHVPEGAQPVRVHSGESQRAERV